MTDSLAPADPKKSVAVFASAGTGKTWLLVARILRLLLAGAEPDSILAITFTRKAAAEIQQRLTEWLEKWLTLDDQELAEDLKKIGVDRPERHLDRARALFETVQFADQGIRIATFHSFFQELLQRFPLEAGIPAGFTIPQREQSARLHQAAEDLLFEEARRNPGSELSESMNVIVAETPSLSELRRILEGFRGHILEWRAFAGELTLEQLRAHLRDEVFRLDEASDPAQDPDAEPELRRLADLLEKSGASEKSHQAKAAVKLCRALEDEEAGSLEQAQQLNDALYDSEKQDIRSSLPPTSKAAQDRLGENGVEEINRLLSRWPPQIRKTLDELLRQKACKLNSYLYTIVDQLTDNYQRLKQAQGYLDYDDLLWFSNQLMNGGVEWVQYKLGQSFRHVLVDEFQDTDALSWQTLKIFLEALHESGDGSGSAFIVGDPKQSIYQWRRANPDIQREASIYLQSHLQADKPVPRDASWRSSKVIIDFINSAFGKGGVFHLQDDFSPHETHLEGLWGRVELLPPVAKEARDEPAVPDPDQPLRDPLTEPRPEVRSTHLEQMAEKIAERIRQIIDQRVAIEDRATGVRAAEFRDCMILVNRRTHVPQIEHALTRHEIPFARQSRQTLLQHLEVRDMQALLQFLIRPADDLHLVQVLRSPLYSVTDEELMELACTGEKSDRWTDRLKILSKQKDPEHPLQRAHKNFKKWRKLVGRIPTHDLLDLIYFKTDALRCYQRAWPGERGERAVSNLTRFIELTLEFDSGRYPSTAAFVHFIEEMRCGRVEGYDAPDLVSLKSDDQEDRVQILTVHAAKGLERPIVVYAELEKPTERGRHGDVLIDWPADEDRPRRFLFRPRKADMDSRSLECLELVRQKRQAEDFNRAYVAFTRARQMLILCQHEELHQKLLALSSEFSEEESGLLALGPDPQPANPLPPSAAPEPDCTGLDTPIELPSVVAPSATDALDEPMDSEDMRGVLARQYALERGSLIHALIEMLEAGEPDPAKIERLAHGQNRNLQDPDFQDWLDEARRVVGDPELDPVFRPDPQTRVYTEVPILCRIEEGEGFGIIDRLLVTPDQAWVIDFKSHATEDPKELEEIAGHYTEQMNEYARFVRLVYPDRPVRCSLLFTRSRRLHDMSGA